MPLISGICTSNIRQRVSATAVDCTNDSAEANVRAEYPSDRTRSPMAARLKSSSSTIDISGISVNGSFHSGYQNDRCADASSKVVNQKWHGTTIREIVPKC